MKLETEESDFKPVKIILENKNELLFFASLINAGNGDLKQFTEKHKPHEYREEIDWEALESSTYELWCELNKALGY